MNELRGRTPEFSEYDRTLRQMIHYLAGIITSGLTLYRRGAEGYVPVSCSPEMSAITGYTPQEHRALLAEGGWDPVAPEARSAFQTALEHPGISKYAGGDTCCVLRKGGGRAWVGFRSETLETGEETLLSVSFFKASLERRFLRQISLEDKDAVCVIDAETRELLYISGDSPLWGDGKNETLLGRKCYRVFHRQDGPCPNCPLRDKDAQVNEWERTFPAVPGRRFRVGGQRMDWRGGPAYIFRIKDVTEEYRAREELERLETYYQTLIKNMPGGMAVIQHRQNGEMLAEFVSEGFAEMTGMTQEESLRTYSGDALAGVHPDDRDALAAELAADLADGRESARMTYRLRKGKDGYLWVRNTSSFIHNKDGSITVYAVYEDITEEVRRQQENRRRYADTLRRYREGVQKGAILTSHSNITANKILEVHDSTRSGLLQRFGADRDSFFEGIAGLMERAEDQEEFRTRFSGDSLKALFRRGVCTCEMDGFAVFPGEEQGRYVHIVEEILLAPDTGELTGVMSMGDTTDLRLRRSIQQRLISDNYDMIVEMNLRRDHYRAIEPDEREGVRVREEGRLHTWIAWFIDRRVLPRDRERCRRKLEPAYIREILACRSSYTLHYFVESRGQIRAKSALIFYEDARLDRVCMAQADVTESTQEQQALLRMLAQTFEAVAMLNVHTEEALVHTRQSVMNGQAPTALQGCGALGEFFLAGYAPDEQRRLELMRKLSLSELRDRLGEQEAGYSFVSTVRQNGQTSYKQINVTWGNEDRQSICLVRRDVTRSVLEEEEQTEHLRSALAVARDANQAKSDFLASVSHDIRTPMNAIIGMTDLALARRSDAAQVDESLHIIKESASHLLELIGDILDMSRIESGRLIMSQEPFSQRGRIKMLADRTRVLAQQRGRKFNWSIDVEHDACVGDALRIDQILENLLGNAVKFTPPGGSILLAVKELPPKNKHTGRYRYQVRDTGIGMSEETLSHLYEPFYRDDSAHVRETEGSGLGLSIVKNLVDYRGGVMTVESAPGKGSTFTVELPLPFASPAELERLHGGGEAKAGPEELEGCLRGRRLLLVEDHPINRLVACRILEDAGARLTAAANGSEGVAAFRAEGSGGFDAVVMDIQMPVMDGYEAARTIRAGEPPGKRTPIIAMTANAFAQDVQKCFAAGMDAHVAKPVDRAELLRTLVRLMD